MTSPIQARFLRLLVALALVSTSSPTIAQDHPPPKRAPQTSKLPSKPPEVVAQPPLEEEPFEEEQEQIPDDPPLPDPNPEPVLQQAAPEPKEEPPPKATAPNLNARCTPAESRKVLAATRNALARIAAPVGSSLGVVYHTNRHVLTTFDAVRAGRGVRVTLTDGIERDARIVAIDRERNLALLALDAPSRIAPLQAGAALSVGDPLLLLTRSSTYDEQQPNQDVLVPGAVISKSGDSIRSNALDTRHPTYGAPLLDCRGRVVAIAADMFSDNAVLLAEAPPIEDSVGRQPEYRGDWSMAHPSFGAVFQYDRMIPDMHRVGVGLSLGTALIGEDQWYFPLRASVLAMGQAFPDDADTVTRTGLRLQLETGVGYRFMLSDGDMPVYLTPTIGVAMGYEHWWEDTNHTAITKSPCSLASPCDVESWTETRTLDLAYLRPAFGVALQIGFAEIGYTFMLDGKQPDMSTHQWYLGVQF